VLSLAASFFNRQPNPLSVLNSLPKNGTLTVIFPMAFQFVPWHGGDTTSVLCWPTCYTSVKCLQTACYII